VTLENVASQNACDVGAIAVNVGKLDRRADRGDGVAGVVAARAGGQIAPDISCDLRLGGGLGPRISLV